mmetsp:Transcript_77841/g.166898  ORF Transcript_77841/g.166898 Transcript_77841/m.166898 type:complete len:431 (+) Transcript_77841:99-1391(+)
MEGRPARASLHITRCSEFIGKKTSVGFALPVAVGVEGLEIDFVDPKSPGWIKAYLSNPKKRKFVQARMSAAPAAAAQSWAAGAWKTAYVCKLRIGGQTELVVVKLMNEGEGGEDEAFEDVEKAARYAERFNDSRLRVATPVLAKLQDPRSLDGMPVQEWSERTVIIEPHLNGKYDKFCWDEGTNYPYHDLPHAFACFTYFSSGRSEIAWDLQGVQVGETYLLTDPLWYTREEGEDGEKKIEECMALHTRHTHCCKTGWHTELEHGKQYRFKLSGYDLDGTRFKRKQVFLAIKDGPRDFRSVESLLVCVGPKEYSQIWEAESTGRATWRFFMNVEGLRLYLTIRESDERDPTSCWVCARVEDAADVPEWIVSCRPDGSKRLAMPVGSEGKSMLMYLTFRDDRVDKRGNCNWACGVANATDCGWIVEACPLY